ncbi:Nn.00g081620.m01.CDS01 [Neocucurbitaria sp. VM-36]
MSSITPPSFVDDGASFAKRIPHRLHPKHISYWLDSTDSSASAYTGSFIDDGADMLLPSHDTPGFGSIDARFYKQRKKKEAKDVLWNDDVKRAISGDMARNLAKIRGLGGVELKRKDQGSSNEEEKKDTVTVPIPLKWGTFVIKAEDGRVIVMDRDGEFDSGPREVRKKSHEATRWIKAAASVEPPSPTRMSTTVLSLPEQRTSHVSKDHKKHSHSHKQKKEGHKYHHSSSPLKLLAPILESEYEEGYQPSAGEDLVSPTQFFMTGGASGWPSRTPTSVVASPGLAPTRYDSSVLKTPVKSRSPVPSPPGGWPSPPLSPVTSVAVEQVWGGSKNVKAWGEDDSQSVERSETAYRFHKSGRSHQSRKARKQDLDNVSTRTYSTYKAPTVEDAPDISSDEKMRGYVQTGWGGSIKSNSVKESEKSGKGRDIDDWTGHAKATGEQSWAGSNHGSRESWKGSAKAADDESGMASQVASGQGWGDNGKTSGTSWDGYERVKTISEVSVVGTGSSRSSLGSRVSSRHGAAAPSHRSQTSDVHSEHRGQTGWGCSQTNRQGWSSRKSCVDDDDWGGGQKTSDRGWASSSKGGSERSWKGSHAGSRAEASRYANGYDEDNETYLNQNWGGTPVRVGSRQTRVAGWD